MNKLEMLKMRLDGETYQSIATSAGISRQRVQQLLSPPKAIRDVVVRKAEGKCQACGIKVGRSGHVHHNGDAVDSYNELENLQLLCVSCHRGAHYGWQNPPQVSSRLYPHICKRCGRKWSNYLEHPVCCPNPHCRSAYWDRDRKHPKHTTKGV